MTARALPLAPDEAADALAFLGQLGRALHRFGAPAHRLETSLERAAAHLGVVAQFFATPTAFFASFEDPARADHPATLLNRTDPGDVDLERLAELDAVLEDVARGAMTCRAGADRVREVVNAPPRYGAVLTAACFVVASAAAARFFGGGVREIVTVATIGLSTGLLAVASPRFPLVGRVFEPAAAFVAALVAGAAAWWIGPLSAHVAVLAGLIVLIPGLTLTTAMTEISTRHLVSGTARLTGAFVLFLSIGFGVALGTRVIELWLGPVPVADPVPLPTWTLALAMMAAAASFTVLFRARPGDFPWILASGVLAFAGARWGALVLGPELGAFVGAALVGAGGNLYANLSRRPASIPVVPGIVLLVPGSIGFESLSSLLASDVVAGMETAFRMSLVAVALVTGLLLANVIVPPRRAL
ncbi:MAG: hypothetical protein DHS20C21_14340 [Gemmatimonadota bacterium]|nr:MAG: hypothetical protein DHS20C21_14340 [Gemmatimonadota bacterium]